MLSWFKRRDNSSGPYLTNEQWVMALDPPPEERALHQLRIILVKGLTISLRRYVDRGLEDFVEDVAQDALLKIMDKYRTFRGDSKFTTWALKVAVREAYSELRKKRYKDVSLEQYSKHDPEDKDVVEIGHEEAGPDRQTHEQMLVEKISRMMKEELSEKQQQVIRLLMIEQVPMTVVAEQMGSNRNAIYKLVHDARLKLKSRLEREGIDPEEMLQQM